VNKVPQAKSDPRQPDRTQSSLDVSGKSVSAETTIESTNPTGTPFTVTDVCGRLHKKSIFCTPGTPGTDFLGTHGRVLPGCCPLVAQYVASPGPENPV